MRRGIGSAGVVKERERAKKMAEVGEALQTERIDRTRMHLDAFRAKLSEFALKYRDRIQGDAEFRERFVNMCESVGVDPIQCSRNGLSRLTEFLGLSSFYSDLSVQVLTQCMVQRKSEFGPLLPMKKCLGLIRAETCGVSQEDVLRAVKSLDCFGAGGVKMVRIAGETYISSLPDEFNSDTATLFAAYSSREGMTLMEISQRVHWPEERTLNALNFLMNEGAIWMDRSDNTYWLLSVWLLQ